MKKKRNLSPQEPYIKHHRKLIESPAWRCLSGNARKALDRIEIEHMRCGGRNNGALVVTYANLREHGVAGDSRDIARALREPEAVGLLEIKRGRGGNGEFRTSNLMRLTYVDGAYVEEVCIDPATNEWSQIKTMDEAKSRIAATRKSRGRNTWKRFAKRNLKLRSL
jgi:hypothetical protein